MMATARTNIVCGLTAAVVLALLPLAGAQAAGDKEHGKKIFAEHCAMCHGDNGGGTDLGPELFYAPGMDESVKIITDGKDSGKDQKMPAFKGTLSEQDIQDVATYLTQEIAGGY